MRPIKFRAWDKDQKKFWHIDLGDDVLQVGHPYHDVFSDNIQQFTGLLDKNGTEIYEGDIVDYRGANYPVVWNDGASNIGEHDDKWGYHLGWYLYRENKAEDCYDEWLEITSDTIYEVIGNIYENSELLATHTKNKDK